MRGREAVVGGHSGSTGGEEQGAEWCRAHEVETPSAEAAGKTVSYDIGRGLRNKESRAIRHLRGREDAPAQPL